MYICITVPETLLECSLMRDCDDRIDESPFVVVVAVVVVVVVGSLKEGLMLS